VQDIKYLKTHCQGMAGEDSGGWKKDLQVL
jgi:hypothetical protein